MKHRAELMKAMHQPRIPGDFHAPFGSDLRPAEWFKVEAPEPRRILNDAVQVVSGNPNLFDNEPLLETDYEYLHRLNLLTDEDRKYMKSEDFKQNEKRTLDYREYCLRNP